MIPELGWPPCRRHGRGFRRATCGPLSRVAGNASSLESLRRRSVKQTAICTSRQALLCSASRDRVLVCSGSSCFRFGLRAAVPPKLCVRVRTTLVPAAVPAAYGCVPRVSGHLSTQTCRCRLVQTDAMRPATIPNAIDNCTNTRLKLLLFRTTCISLSLVVADHLVRAEPKLALSQCFYAGRDIGEIIASLRVAHAGSVSLRMIAFDRV